MDNSPLGQKPNGSRAPRPLTYGPLDQAQRVGLTVSLVLAVEDDGGKTRPAELLARFAEAHSISLVAAQAIARMIRTTLPTAFQSALNDGW